MRRAIVAALAAVLLAVSMPADAITSSRFESRVVKGLNADRSHQLRRDACLDKWALRHARALRGRAYGTLEHFSLQPALADCGYYRAGEVLARSAASPRGVVYFWTRLSPLHAVVVHNERYRRIGVASIKDGEKRITIAVLAARR